MDTWVNVILAVLTFFCYDGLGAGGEELPGSPEIVNLPRNGDSRVIYASAKSSLWFICNITNSNNDNVQFIWFFNNDRLNKKFEFCPTGSNWKLETASPESCILSDTQTAHRIGIPYVQQRHEGIYACRLEGQDDSTTRDTRVRLIVVEDPVHQVGQWQTQINAFVGTSLKIPCNATGKPLPTYKWYKSNTGQLNAADWIFLGKGRVYQDSVVTGNDTGWYKCVATNDQGFITLRTHLHVFGPPDRAAITCELSTLFPQVIIHWTEPASNKAPVLAYKLRLFVITWNREQELVANVTVGHTERRHKFLRLYASMVYKIQVFARNKYGYGRPGTEHFRTYSVSNYTDNIKANYSLHPLTAVLKQIPSLVFVIGASLMVALIVIPLVTWYCITRTRLNGATGNRDNQITFTDRVWNLISGNRGQTFTNPMYNGGDSVVEVNDASTNTDSFKKGPQENSAFTSDE